MLQDMFESKAEHLASKQCERNSIGGCTACHYWSGAITALWELLDFTGVWQTSQQYKEARNKYGLRCDDDSCLKQVAKDLAVKLNAGTVVF